MNELLWNGSNLLLEIVAAYLVHSTLLLAAGWVTVKTFSNLRLDFQKRICKFCAVAGLLTAIIQIAVVPDKMLTRLVLENAVQLGSVNSIEVSSRASKKTAQGNPNGKRKRTKQESQSTQHPLADLQEHAQPEQIPNLDQPSSRPWKTVVVDQSASIKKQFENAALTDGGDLAFDSSANRPALNTSPVASQDSSLQLQSEPTGSDAEQVRSLQPEPDSGTRRAINFAVCAISIALSTWMVLALLWLGAQYYVLRIRMQSFDVPFNSTGQKTLKELLKSMKVRRKVWLLESEEISQPIAVGFFWWMIVLPVRMADELDETELKGVLAHELAHFRAGDLYWLWIGKIFCTCFFFQPLNFLARRHWMELGEQLCDQEAVRFGVSPMELAKCLTKVVGWQLGPQSKITALAATGNSNIVTRVERLLTFPALPQKSMFRSVCCWMTLGILGSVALATPRLQILANSHENSESPNWKIDASPNPTRSADRDLVFGIGVKENAASDAEPDADSDADSNAFLDSFDTDSAASVAEANGSGFKPAQGTPTHDSNILALEQLQRELEVLNHSLDLAQALLSEKANSNPDSPLRRLSDELRMKQRSLNQRVQQIQEKIQN